MRPLRLAMWKSANHKTKIARVFPVPKRMKSCTPRVYLSAGAMLKASLYRSMSTSRILPSRRCRATSSPYRSNRMDDLRTKKRARSLLGERGERALAGNRVVAVQEESRARDPHEKKNKKPKHKQPIPYLSLPRPSRNNLEA